jgi:quinol monooxygenase YgiN
MRSFSALTNLRPRRRAYPEDQWRLVDLLTRATEESVRHAPGFISSKLHRSLDGKKVAMYAHWRSMEAYQAMRESPAPGGYLEQALTIAKFDPGLYEVVGSRVDGALARTF